MFQLILLCAMLLQQAPAQDPAAAPLVLPPDSPQLHLVTQTAPPYPAIARAAHVNGIVTVEIKIGLDGHIVSAKPLSGSEMLWGAATDALREWRYAPVLVDGKPVVVVTTVAIPFDLNAPAGKPSPDAVQDRKLEMRLQPLEGACTQAIAENTAPDKQVAQCQKAAEVADQLSEYSHWSRSRVFTLFSTALRHDKQYPEALTAANKAVTSIQEGLQTGAQASAAYSVRAEAEVKLGKLAEASKEATLAEDEERRIIAHAMEPVPNPAFTKVNQERAKKNYVPILKSLLVYHAQILSALGQPAEAAARMAEADKL